MNDTLRRFFNIFYPFLITRPMIREVFLKGSAHLDGFVGVEIGVAKGINAFNILRILPVKKLYLVDPYVPYLTKRGMVSVAYQNDIKSQAVEYLKHYSKQVEFIFDVSTVACLSIPDGLDFVYIDDGHDYKSVSNDLNCYYPKVKKGGFIGGHDYEPLKHTSVNSVYDAVNDFKKQKKLVDPFVERTDYWFIKGECEDEE